MRFLLIPKAENLKKSPIGPDSFKINKNNNLNIINSETTGAMDEITFKHIIF